MNKKYFGTDGIRGKSNSPKMNAHLAQNLGMAAGIYLKQNHSVHRVVIGKDTRLSGYMIENAIVSGLLAVGLDVFLLGPMPTPAIAMLTRSLRADFGIMISASHNSYDDNGIKLFDQNGLKLSDKQELEIEDLMQQNLEQYLAPADKIGRAKRVDDETGRYVEYVKSTFPRDLSLEGMKIVIDCANGAGYKVGPKLLWELGAEVISINISPNGCNINENCGSNHPKTLSEVVLKEQADIGFALDGDADRIVVCDNKGNIIDGEHILAAIAIYMKQNNSLHNDVITTTIMSSLGFDQFMQSHQISVNRTAVGDRYVTENMRKNNIALGGEPSGHIIIGKYSTTGDGLVAALQILAYLKSNNLEPLSINKLFQPYPQILTNIPITKNTSLENSHTKQLIKQIEEQLSDKGRLLIRKSGTEPLVRILVEGKDKSQIQKISEYLVKELSEEFS